MASFKAIFPVLQELFAKNQRGGPFGPPPPSGARVNDSNTDRNSIEVSVQVRYTGTVTVTSASLYVGITDHIPVCSRHVCGVYLPVAHPVLRRLPSALWLRRREESSLGHLQTDSSSFRSRYKHSPGRQGCLQTRVVTCGAIESSCSRSVSSSSNHIWKECAGPGLGYWRCWIFYGWNLTTCDSRYRNLVPPFASVRDAAGTLPGPLRAANRMEVVWINYVTSYNPASDRLQQALQKQVWALSGATRWKSFLLGLMVKR